MDGLERINAVIKYIEENICEEVDYKELAKITLVSEYEFRRIFSYVIGMPVGEYIRKRRLSLAGEELKADLGTATEIGIKYGYDSLSSFARAFKTAFGVTPQEAKDPDVSLPVFVPPRLEVVMRGDTEFSYTEANEPAFYINGTCGESDYTDTCCCESVWQKYERENPQSSGEIYAAYFNGENRVLCYIGARLKNTESDKASVKIESGKWLLFDASGMQERELNGLYERIRYSFLPSSIYVKDESRPNMEIFGETKTTVMIPVQWKGDVRTRKQ